MEPVLSLQEASQREFPGTSLAVIGQPLHHSISPQMHNAALHAMAQVCPRFEAWRYYRIEVPPAQLEDALSLLSSKGFKGLNLTIPHKVHALDYVDHVDPAARLLGAVNTLRCADSGWQGFNTDGYGFAAAVNEQLSLKLRGRDVVLLGAGGAARAIAVQCLQDGCRSLWIGNRSRERLQTLMTQLGAIEPSADQLHPFSSELPPYHDLPTDALVVNATSLGLKEGDPAPIDLARLNGKPSVYDTTYGLHDSQLMREAHSLGLKAANGLSMLIWQGVRALEIWTDQSIPVNAMREAAIKALSHHA